MSNQLEVDSGHKNLVASWFGLENSKPADNCDRRLEGTIDVDGVSLSASVINSDGLVNEEIGETRAQRLAKADVTTYVGEKLKKKLHKSKRRRNDLTSEEAQTVKASKMANTRNDSDDDGDSRTLAVTKPKHQKLDVRPELLTSDARLQHIQQKLSDPLTTKNARKRLRRQLAKLEQTSTSKLGEGFAHPQNEKVPSSCVSGSQSKDCRSKPSGKNIRNSVILPGNKSVSSSHLEGRTTDCSEHSNQKDVKESRKADRNIEADKSIEADVNMEADVKTEDSETAVNESEEKSSLKEMSSDSRGRKRKRKKTRSKQKNIKKDNRPEHLKPGYKPSGTEV